MRSRDGVLDQSPSARRTTRLRLSVAATARSSDNWSPAPDRSMAFTSMCEASHGALSASRPVSTLTTPPGTSEVASTSDSETAGSGCRSDASATTVLPLTMAGATTETNPSSGALDGASTATTPVGSGREKLKYGPATGFDEPCTWATLSDHPAYQTQRSMAASTAASAFAADTPSAARTSATNCPRRPSITSATRYSTCPRLYAVAPDQPGNALRAADTASRASLRDAIAALARKPPRWSVAT